jgi:hypothetical protein
MRLSMIAAVSAMALAAGSAGAAVVVPGTSNPFLAGASGADSVTMNGFTDPASLDAPVGIAVSPGQTVTIGNVTGLVSNGPCCTPVGPTGGPDTSSSPVTANGFTELVSGFTNLPINSLIGVFYGLNPADPGVDSVFEIGNGGSFTVPTGATELHLATVDGFQWANNSGAFTADVSVPEPATWAMTLIGLFGVGAVLRRSRQTRTALAS